MRKLANENCGKFVFQFANGDANIFGRGVHCGKIIIWQIYEFDCR